MAVCPVPRLGQVGGARPDRDAELLLRRLPLLLPQAHLVSLSRVDVLDVLSNFEGEDCNSVLRVLREEHQNTVMSLTDKRDPSKASGDGADANADAGDSDDEQQQEQPSDHTLQTLRARVTAMEQKLAQCVDDMQAARECTEVLPHLVYLVNAAASKPPSS